LNLCQAAARDGVQRFIHTSTSEVYGTAQYVPIDEHHPLVPQSPYSASKVGRVMPVVSRGEVRPGRFSTLSQTAERRRMCSGGSRRFRWNIGLHARSRPK
jgi:hypothetical protein